MAYLMGQCKPIYHWVIASSLPASAGVPVNRVSQSLLVWKAAKPRLICLLRPACRDIHIQHGILPGTGLIAVERGCDRYPLGVGPLRRLEIILRAVQVRERTVIVIVYDIIGFAFRVQNALSKAPAGRARGRRRRGRRPRRPRPPAPSAPHRRSPWRRTAPPGGE